VREVMEEEEDGPEEEDQPGAAESWEQSRDALDRMSIGKRINLKTCSS
jgi:hypothetical protein